MHFALLILFISLAFSLLTSPLQPQEVKLLTGNSFVELLTLFSLAVKRTFEEEKKGGLLGPPIPTFEGGGKRWGWGEAAQRKNSNDRKAQEVFGKELGRRRKLR